VLYQSATTVEAAHLSGDRHTLYRALDKLKLYFTIQGIMTLIGIIVAALAMTMGVLGAIIEAIR
jgi:uncharacterized membrane protein